MYEITGPLGAGGMGEVYRAHDSKLKRDVAIKILPDGVRRDPDRIARFEREAQVLASLKHPNIGAVYGLEESADTSAMVMELVEGEDLSQLIARTPMPVPRALDIARQVAAALEAAHEQGVIHRDLKPGNIRVQRDGLVKVLDFGLAKSLTVADGVTMTHTALSNPGTVVGTAAYMSPEQARGEVTGRETDIWAFGVVLYEMLSGVSPFARPSTAETLAQVLAASPDESRLPTAVPASVHRLMRRCLERDPKRRWHHMGDARIEIEETMATPASEDAAAATGAAPMTRRRAIAYGAAGLATLAAGVGAGRWLGRGDGSAPPPSYRRLTFRRGLIRSARVAPDGQTILYSALWDGDRCRVHTVRVDGPESRPLDLPDANLLAISRSGELAVALGSHEQGILTYGTLARVPMAGGTPRQILEGVKFADWSADGAELAIVRHIDGRDRLEYPIGTVLFAPTLSEGVYLGFPRISPDGNRVAFVHYIGGDLSLNGHVSLVDRSGTVTPLSPDYLNIHGLCWKGDEIVYTAADERPLFRGFHSVTPGGTARTITRVPGNTTLWDALPDGRLLIAQTDDRAVLVTRLRGDIADRDLSWLDASWAQDLSPDGRWLLFTEYGEGGGAESAAYLRGTDGSPAVRIGAGRAVALSPDAQWALCVSAEGVGGQVDLLPTGAGEPRTLQIGELTFAGARWLPDNKRLVLSASEPGRPQRLYLYDVDRGQHRAITPEGVIAWAVSPDGTAVAAKGPDRVIRRYAFDNSEPREIAGLSAEHTPVGWINDGLLVMRFGVPPSPLGQIYRLDTRSGRIDPWKNILPGDRTGIMGQMTFQVTPDGHTQAYTWHRALSSLYLAGGLA